MVDSLTTSAEDTDIEQRPEAPATVKSEQAAPGGKAKPDADAGDDQVENASDQDGKSDDEATRKKRRPFVWVIAIVVVLGLIAGGAYYYFANKGLVTTDDAYTDGRTIDVAPQIAGIVTSLDVTDNQFVHKGDPIIHIDARQYQIDRAQAKGALDTAKAQYLGQQLAAEVARKNFPAQLEQAQARLANAKAVQAKAASDLERQKSLPKQATTQQEIDSATAAAAEADAQVQQADAQVQIAMPVPQLIGESDQQVQQLNGQLQQAQAKLDQANLNFSYTVVTAPQDGWVTKRNVEVGNYITAGQQIMTIVSPQIWITANFKENQLTDLRPGQPVKITIDAYPQLKLTGHVDSIQEGSGSKFSAFPAENATGNYIKIVQRVPVKIDIDSGLDPKIPLPLGISVEPTVSVQ
jgi:membrane fusion protein (multidrug efflux system)